MQALQNDTFFFVGIKKYCLDNAFWATMTIWACGKNGEAWRAYGIYIVKPLPKSPVRNQKIERGRKP